MNATKLEGSCRRILAVLRWPVGGIRTYVLYNYPALAAAGYRFSFVGPAEMSFRAFADELRGWDGADFVEAPLRGRHCRLSGAVRRLLRSGRFDLVHSHGLTAGTQVAWANIGIGVTHVVTMHDVFRPGQVAGLAGRAKLWILRRLLQRVDALVAVSEDVRANLLAYLPKLRRGTGRIVSILNGIDTQRFADTGGQAPYSIRERLDLAGDVVLVGFLGRFMEQKGFLPLLDALRELLADPPAAPFHLVALGSGDFEREYRLEVQRRGLAAKVSFLEFVPDVGPILRQLDLLVMPSLWEACPLLPMEAMALGIPVLGSDCIGLGEVLRGTPSIMVPAGDAKAWCQALREAIARPWRDAARAYAPEACKRFDVARSAERLRQLFDELLCESRPRAAAAALNRISRRSTLAVPK